MPKRKRNIEWSQDSWNLITGCLGPKNDGVLCVGCYASNLAHRLRGRFGYDENDPFKLTWHADKLNVPLLRNKPTIWFVSSMGEILCPEVPFEWLREMLLIIRRAHWHIFIVLTKQYENLERMRLASLFPTPTVSLLEMPSNLWVGVSITKRDQLQGLKRLAEFKGPALKFVSFEPMIEDLSDADLSGLDWIIIGARTRQGKTPAFIPERKWVQQLVWKAKDPDLALPIPVFLKPNLGDYVRYGWFKERIEEMPFDKIGGWPK